MIGGTKFLALAIVAFGCSSLAQEALPAGLAPATAAKLAANVYLLDEPDSYCTVSPITPDGYMLTALHCVRTCLTDAGAGDNATNPLIGLPDLFVANRTKLPVTCSQVAIPALGVTSVSVVATGAALAVYDSHFMFDTPLLFAELKGHGFAARADDYAILKVATVKPLTCLPLGQAAAGSPVWAIGYPLPDDEKVKPSLKASAGKLYANALESRFYAGAPDDRERQFDNAVYSDAGVIYSSAQVQPGQSGGPVVDASGAIIGVTSGYTSVGDPELHEGVATSSAKVMQGLPPALASDLAKKNASCR